jgi:hypothetical protein
MSRKKKGRPQYQPGTMRAVQSADGLVWVTVKRHVGRVTQNVDGPASDDYKMSLELFKSERRFLAPY